MLPRINESLYMDDLMICCKLTEIHKTIIPDILPWPIRTPNIILTICKFRKNNIFQEELEKVKEKYPKHSHIFMDGSKLDKITGCDKIHKGKTFKKHLPNDTSIFSAEACAISMALVLISESRNNKFIIFSDSLSVLESLKNRKFDHSLIIRILCKLKNLSNDNDIQICWVPSRTSISGNDQADKAAWSTINLITEKKFKIPHTDFKMKINKYMLQQRQKCWNNNENNKLLEIKPTLGEWKQSLKKKRKEEITLSRLQIGHTRITHLFTQRKTTKCYACQIKYTVKHILIECTDLAHIIKTFYSANNMEELFQNTEINNVISFLKTVKI